MKQRYLRKRLHDDNDSGGMEVLFSYKRSHDVKLPCQDGDKPPTIRYLIKWLLDNLLSDKSRPDLFSQGDTV